MKKQRGFTLMEVLVAISLVSMVSAFITPAFISTARFTRSSELRSLAIDATDQQIDSLRFVDPSTLPSTGTASVVVTISGTPFTIAQTYCSIAAYCDSVTRYITFTTSYKGTTYYATQTVFTQLQ